MKYIFISLLVCVTACNTLQKEADLSGVYITAYQNEFYTGSDTLVVLKANAGKGSYTIERHTGVSKVDDARTDVSKMVIEKWTLEYDPEKQTLFELKEGKTLIWNEPDKTLHLGNRTYRKVA